MNPIEQAKILWPKAKPLLLPYDGVATEILVTGMKNDSLLYSVSEIESFVKDPEILVVSSQGLDNPIPLTSESKKKLVVEPASLIQHSIRGSFVGDRDICFYIWVDGPNQIYEVDAVFWNDIHFPKHNTETHHIETFSKLVGLAERIRNNTANSKCILTPEHNGPVEELFQNEHVVIW